MAVFSNRFHVYAYGEVIRITFEDCIIGTEGVIQTSVVMKTTDAEQLSKAISDAISTTKNTQ